MAFYIDIIKTSQIDKIFFYYIYQFSIQGEGYISSSGKIRYKSKEVNGKLKIDKKSGDVQVLELAESDSGMYAQRASWALINHWKNGEFPEKTCWAS